MNYLVSNITSVIETRTYSEWVIRCVNKIISVNVMYKSLTNKVAREAPGIQENLRQKPLGPMALGVVGRVRMGCDPGPIPDSA